MASLLLPMFPQVFVTLLLLASPAAPYASSAAAGHALGAILPMLVRPWTPCCV
jgi:hypothetical protein